MAIVSVEAAVYDECHEAIQSCDVRVDFCGFGTPWKKSTRLRGTLIGLRIVERVCRGGSVCCFSGRRHVVLKGKDKHGRYRTLVAQPYPQSLCAALALLVSSAVANGTGLAVPPAGR